jgi:protein disulfide-isomerase
MTRRGPRALALAIAAAGAACGESDSGPAEGTTSAAQQPSRPAPEDSGTGAAPGAPVDVAASADGAAPATHDEPATPEDSTAQIAKWLTSYDDALALAAKEQKLVLADFTGSDWCDWCQKLKSEVFDTPEFAKWAAGRVVLLELDFPRRTKLSPDLKKQNEQLGRKYQLQVFPTVLFLDAKGKVVGRSGYKAGGAAAWIRSAEQQMRARR